jgi:putative phosphoribosyl transferase
MFRDRQHAGEALAAGLAKYRQQAKLLVMGLPRGGVPLASIVAKELSAPLDICLVRKLGVPWQPELALGAVADGGVRVLDAELVRQCELKPGEIETMVQNAQREIARRHALYRGDLPPEKIQGRTVIIVDDGLATGSTMFAAVRTLRAAGAEKIVVAVPVGPPSTCRALRAEADEVVCIEEHEPFYSVGSWYEDFGQVEDDEVREILARAGKPKS